MDKDSVIKPPKELGKFYESDDNEFGICDLYWNIFNDNFRINIVVGYKNRTVILKPKTGGKEIFYYWKEVTKEYFLKQIFINFGIPVGDWKFDGEEKLNDK
jgi:hypothetical protein